MSCQTSGRTAAPTWVGLGWDAVRSPSGGHTAPVSPRVAATHRPMAVRPGASLVRMEGRDASTPHCCLEITCFIHTPKCRKAASVSRRRPRRTLVRATFRLHRLQPSFELNTADHDRPLRPTGQPGIGRLVVSGALHGAVFLRLETWAVKGARCDWSVGDRMRPPSWTPSPLSCCSSWWWQVRSCCWRW